MNFSRILFLIQSIAMMVLLGTVYVWGVFRVEVESLYGISATLSGLPYMVSLVSYALAMLIAGKFMSTHRTHFIIVGVTLFVGGLWLSSLVDNIYALTITYGLFLGTGVALIVFSLTIWPLFQSIPHQPTINKEETLVFDIHAFRSFYVVFVLSLISGLTIIG
jgi:hypothetical protein